MSLVINDCSKFRNIIRFLKNISSDVFFFFDEGHLIIQTTDVFSKILVNIQINKKYFDLYERCENKVINIIHLHQMVLFSNRLSKIKMIFNKDIMNLELEDENIIKKFKYPISNKKVEKSEIELKYNNHIEMKIKDLYDIVEKNQGISSETFMEINENEIMFYSSGDFFSIKTKKNIEHKINNNIRIKINANKLLNICKLYKFSEYMQIFIDQNYPLKFVSNIDGIEISIFLSQENI